MLLTVALRYGPEVRLFGYCGHDCWLDHPTVLLWLYLSRKGDVEVDLGHPGIPVLRVCTGHGDGSLTQGTKMAQRGSLAPSWLLRLPWHNPLGLVP